MRATDLRERIERREAVVCIIGLGHAGLPLAARFAEVGFTVVGIDVNESRVDAINRGESYVQDVPQDLMGQITGHPRAKPGAATPHSSSSRVGSLRATSNYDVIGDADVAVVCVPTPLGKTRDPDLSYIIAATEEIARRLHPGMLVVLESTTYPGTTEEVIVPVLQGDAAGSRVVGSDLFLAFSPERIDPSRRDWTLKTTPKVLGGVTRSCFEMAQALYQHAVDRIVPVSGPKAAELVKLLENTFRATNVALVNEIAIMCHKLDVDVWEVIEAAETKPFGFMPFYPGPGIGGHCIPVDPQYLAWKLKTLNYTARFIGVAEEINRGMPEYVLGRVSDALNDIGKPLNGSRILVLGVSYKADVGDARESPALDLIELLEAKGAEVSYNDPLVPHVEMDSMSLRSVHLDAQALQESDCVVVTTPHSSYDWRWVVENSPLVFDTRNAVAGVISKAGRVVKL